jgi:hypothetical protein
MRRPASAIIRRCRNLAAAAARSAVKERAKRVAERIQVELTSTDTIEEYTRGLPRSWKAAIMYGLVRDSRGALTGP